MTTKPNAVCEICNAPYHKCSKCDSMPHYKRHTCSPACYQIYTVLIETEEGVLTDEEAAKQYAYLDITLDSDFSKFRDGVASAIKRTIENGTPKADAPKKRNRTKLFE